MEQLSAFSINPELHSQAKANFKSERGQDQSGHLLPENNFSLKNFIKVYAKTILQSFKLSPSCGYQYFTEEVEVGGMATTSFAKHAQRTKEAKHCQLV